MLFLMTYTRRNFPLRLAGTHATPASTPESLINYANDLRTTDVYFLPLASRGRAILLPSSLSLCSGTIPRGTVPFTSYTRLDASHPSPSPSARVFLLQQHRNIPTRLPLLFVSRVADPTVWPAAAACLLKLSN